MADSLQNVDKRVIFRETFENEQAVRKNNGTLNNITFLNGTAVFNSLGSSYITYKETHSGTCSVRLKLYYPSVLAAVRYLFDFRNSASSGVGYAYINTSATSITAPTGTVYVNSIATTTVAVGWLDIIISGLTFTARQIIIGNAYSLGAGFNDKIELFEIYSGTLTAEEVKNLSENKRYKDITTHGEQLGADALSGYGDFSGPGAWTLGANWNITEGVLRGTGATANAFRTCLTIGVKYKLQFTISSYTSGSVKFQAGSTIGAIYSSAGTFTEYLTASASGDFIINGETAFNGDIDNITIRPVIVESTKLILDVCACADGTVRNKLSENTYNELVVNQTFQTDTWWTKGGAGVTIANGAANFNNTGDSLSTPALVTIGRKYRVTFTVNVVAGSILISLPTGGSGWGTTRTTSGTYTQDLIAAATGDGKAVFVPTAFTGTITFVSIKEVVPSVVNTAITVLKEGEVYTPKFTGTTSRIDCGSYDSLIGDKTVTGWFRTKSKGGTSGGGGGVIISNGIFSVLFYSNIVSEHRLLIISDGATITGFSGNLFNIFNKLTHFAITRTSTGIANIYINGVLASTANIVSGTPTVAGVGNILIGNSAAGSRQHDGILPSVRVYDGLLTPQEIAQIYSNEKKNYGL